MAVVKFPPPPMLPSSFGGFGQQLNRWLIELQSILNSDGLIEPNQVDGLPEVYDQVATNTGNIATNTGNIATNATDIATLQISVAANSANIAALQVALAALQIAVTAIPIVRNGSGAPAPALGNINDWYADTSGLNIYVKTAITTWVMII